MRFWLALCSLAVAAPAAAAGKSSHVAFDGTHFETRGLPALSAKGTIVAVATVDPDGDRGLPNLLVDFLPLDGRAPANTVVLTVAEAAEKTGKLADIVEPRLDLVNAQLAAAGFVPLVRAELYSAVTDGTLQVHGKRGEVGTLAVGCPASIANLFTSPTDESEIVVELAGCVAGWRALHLGPAPFLTPKADPEAASNLNTQAMRKLKKGDLTGAMAGFRAALARDPGHVKAHYNLACAGSLAHDRATALAELEWLVASDDAAAKARIVKARTDPDLAFIRGDAQVAAILGTQKNR